MPLRRRDEKPGPCGFSGKTKDSAQTPFKSVPVQVFAACVISSNRLTIKISPKTLKASTDAMLRVGHVGPRCGHESLATCLNRLSPLARPPRFVFLSSCQFNELTYPYNHLLYKSLSTGLARWLCR